MKRLLLIILPLLLIVGCSQKPVDETTLIEKEGVMYLPNSDTPYTGEVFINYDTSEKLYQGTYENGLLISHSYLNKDGSVKEPINYETLVLRDDRLYTTDTNEPYWGPVFSLHENGQKKEEVTIKDGKPNGVGTVWYINGNKEYEKTFKDGKEDGLEIGWYINGNKKYEKTIKDGKPDGLWTGWYINGNKEYEKTFKDGKKDGLWNSWYENGQKKEELTFKDGKEDGLWTFWNENGQKKSESTYKDGWEVDYRIF